MPNFSREWYPIQVVAFHDDKSCSFTHPPILVLTMSMAPPRELPETAFNLGELVEDFAVSRSEVIAAAVTLVVCFFLCPVAFFLKNPRMIAPVDSRDYWAIAGCAVLMLIFLIGGINVMLKIYAKRDMRVLLFEHGFVSFKPEQVFSSRWDEIEWTKEIFKFKDCAVLDALTVCSRSGDEWTLDRMSDALRDSDRLAVRIQTEAAIAGGPEVLAKLEAGQNVAFGAVTLGPAGIMNRNKLLDWADVAAIEPHGFGLRIRQRGAWFVWATIAANELVNKHLLVAVAMTMKETHHAEMPK